MNGTVSRICVRIAAAASILFLTACAGASGGAAGRPQMVGALCSRASDSCNSVGGFSGNTAGDGVTGATIAGGGQRGAPNSVTAEFGTVGGGQANVAGEGSTVAGGYGNTAINFHAAVGGGANNVARAHEATVAGGFKNVASERFATVGGGALNVASNLNATVAGGSGNVASFTFATVGGGTQNEASNTSAVVAGGDHNLSQGAYSAILGGLNNVATANMSSIGGGAGNSVHGLYSTVAGGLSNSIEADYSFAAGRKARVLTGHQGTFLFADSTDFPFPSVAPNEFAVRATGGIRLVTAVDQNGQALSGVRLSAGSGSWDTLSDVNAKSGFSRVDGRQILDRLMTLPISSWSYKGQSPAVRHIGPTAQDFHAAFGLGRDDRYISTVDAEGIALAAIQELYRINMTVQAPQLETQVQLLQRQLLISNLTAAMACAIALAALWSARRRTRPGYASNGASLASRTPPS